MKQVILLLALLSTFNSQGFSQTIDAFGINNSAFVPVFVGGWDSCNSLRSKKEKEKFGRSTPHKMFLFNQAVNYVKTVNKHSEIGIKKIALVCANTWSQDGFLAQGSIRLQIYNVKKNEVVRASKKSQLANIDSNQDNTLRVLMRKLPIKDKRPHLTTRLLEVADGLPLVVFGHSYGGWIGKRIIEILAAPEVYRNSKYTRDRVLYWDTTRLLRRFNDFPVHTFITLEAISAAKCRVATSIWSGLAEKLGKDGPKGCRNELQSFRDETKKRRFSEIRSLSLDETISKLENWYNIVLVDSDLPTRAGISTVNGVQNIELEVSPYGTERDFKKSQAHPFKNAHHMLGIHSRTWNKACELTLGDESLCNALENLTNKGR